MVTKEEAQKYLSDVDPGREFFVHDGRVLRNMEEFSLCLKDIKKEDFEHHVNHEKNDFCNWVTDIMHDKELAGEIKKTKTSSAMQKKVEARIKKLKRA